MKKNKWNGSCMFKNLNVPLQYLKSKKWSQSANNENKNLKFCISTQHIPIEKNFLQLHFINSKQCFFFGTPYCSHAKHCMTDETKIYYGVTILTHNKLHLTIIRCVYQANKHLKKNNIFIQ